MVQDAFRRVRIHAVQHMTACEKANLRWGETAITEIVISRAAKAANVLSFTQPGESVSGADWIWWWVDGNSAYGMLVQAKRMTTQRGKWHFDFGYRNGTQRMRLISSAASLELVPVYALYLGTADYRNREPCPEGHRTRHCLACAKRSVSLMPALLADQVIVDNSRITYERSVALEEMFTPDSTGALFIPELKKQLAPELDEFMRMPQTGSRAVAKAMIVRVLKTRIGQFNRVSTPVDSAIRGGGHDHLGPIFPEMPADEGHWGIPYFEHILEPLQHSPPDYVLEIDSGDVDADYLRSTMPPNVGGIVVVRLPQNG